MKRYTHIQIFAEGLIAHGITDTDAKAQIDIWEVRAGIIGPTGIQPGYAVFLGIGKKRNVYGKNPLIFLHEREEKLQGSLLEKVTDDAIRLRCSTLYADRGSQRTLEGFYGSLWKHIQDRRLNISIVPAPSSDDPEYGAALIQEALATKALKMLSTETTLRNQLKQMTSDNLRDDFLYAFQACRFVLCGFQKYSQPQPPAFTRGGFKTHKNIDRRDPGGWT